MTVNSAETERVDTERGWLWNHIGRLAGLLLFLVAMAFLGLLASVGYKPAEGLLAFVIVVFAMIALGGRLHGL
jgi:hypothetical protein